MGRRSKKAARLARTESLIDGLLSKLRSRGEQGLADEDYDALVGIVETLAHLTEVATSSKASIREIRRLLGLDRTRGASDNVERSPEKDATSDRTPEPQESDELDVTSSVPSQTINRDPHGRRRADDFGELVEEYHPHTLLRSGDVCPECARGKLYKYKASAFVAVTGRSPLVATRHTLERL
jgi:predicted house-cleaning noncanonical NTP pyrophosphatase (MazG superfamily)